MPAPKELKDELLRLLDEAYDADSMAISRVTITANDFLYYGGSDAVPEALLSEVTYKLVVNAQEGDCITITIRPRLGPIAWPD